MAALDDALALGADGPDRWCGRAHPDHESMNGMFGGWTAAVLLSSVIRAAPPERRPSALTVSYLATVAPGSEVVIDVVRLASTRSIDHWRADLRVAGAADVLASALVVLATRRDSDGHVEWVMPDLPGPDDLEGFHPPGVQGQQTDMRVPHWFSEWGRGDTRTFHWIRMADPRPVDHAQLAYVSDQQAPRAFYFPGATSRPSATLTMSVYFHATDAELAEVGADPILNECTGTRGDRSTAGQQSRLWSPAGALLATTEQLCWYR